VYDAHLRYGYTLKEIADYLGLHYSTVSKIVQRMEEKKVTFQDPPKPPYELPLVDGFTRSIEVINYTYSEGLVSYNYTLIRKE